MLRVDNHPGPSANSPSGHGGQQQPNGASALNGQLKSADFFSAALAEQSANALLDLQGSSMGLSDPLQFGAAIGDNLQSLTMNAAGGPLTGAGHLALQPPTQPSDNLLNLWGGPLSYVYTLDSLHLHFGRADNVGSEHQIGGFQFPAEVGVRAEWHLSASFRNRTSNCDRDWQWESGWKRGARTIESQPANSSDKIFRRVRPYDFAARTLRTFFISQLSLDRL